MRPYLTSRLSVGSFGSRLAVPRFFATVTSPKVSGGGSPRAFSTLSHDEPIVGNPAPDFEADAFMPSGEIEKVSLRNLLERHNGVCLVFYPLDFTFVCPTELRAFNKKADEFKEKNWALLGVSVDSVYSHGAWSRLPPSEGGIGALSFPLVSDLSKAISRSFRLLKNGAVSLRGCVLIDKEGIVRHTTINDLSMGRSVEETLRVVDMIDYVSQNGAKVCPANWAKGRDSMNPTLQGVKDYYVTSLKD